MYHHDLAALGDLIRAGERLNIYPYSGEDPDEFARRLANEVERQRRHRLLPLAGRLALTAALAAFGIASF